MVSELVEPPNDLWNSILDALEWHSSRDPQKIAYRFLENGDNESSILTYRELDERSHSIAAIIHPFVNPGDRAILLYSPGLDFIVAFLGCLYAGGVAVPLPPPRFQSHQTRLETVVKDAQPKLLLTTQDLLDRLHTIPLAELADLNLKFLTTDDPPAHSKAFVPMNRDKKDLAFLQYTSGSTSSPKGVMVTHRNLLTNVEMIRTGFGWHPETQMVSWLPQFHDMGLIGNTLTPLYVGFTCTQMSPAVFLQHPIKWLRAVTHYRGTCIGAPDFGYDYCTRRIKPGQLNELDLSTVEWAYSGSEPVRIETINRFSNMFQPCGFRRNSFYPCYGLAEATLFVSGGKKENGPILFNISTSGLEKQRVEIEADFEGDSRPMVGCGQQVLAEDIRIVNPDTQTPCPPNTIGEIWISGPHISLGYWNNPEATASTFQNFLKGHGPVPYLRSGDLGFLHKGELFISGRIKDLIIIRGRNFHPEDLEYTAQLGHPFLRSARGAAFKVEVEGEERLIVVNELTREGRQMDVTKIAVGVRESIAQEYGIQAHHIVLIKTGTLPLTTSGKIQRQACRKAYCEGALRVWGESRLGRSSISTSLTLAKRHPNSESSVHFNSLDVG